MLWASTTARMLLVIYNNKSVFDESDCDGGYSVVTRNDFPVREIWLIIMRIYFIYISVNQILEFYIYFRATIHRRIIYIYISHSFIYIYKTEIHMQYIRRFANKSVNNNNNNYQCDADAHIYSYIRTF